MILEMEEQIRTRHLSPTEKLSRHPVGWPGCLKRIGEGSMTEYMYEQACLIPTPTRKIAQEHLVVSDMLEHLDGYDAVKAPRRIECVDIGGLNLDPVKPTPAGFILDPLGL